MEIKTHPTIYVPVDSFSFEWRGQVVIWGRGREKIEEGHPILRGRMHMVEPMRIDYPAEPKTAKARAAA